MRRRALAAVAGTLALIAAGTASVSSGSELGGTGDAGPAAASGEADSR